MGSHVQLGKGQLELSLVTRWKMKVRSRNEVEEVAKGRQHGDEEERSSGQWRPGSDSDRGDIVDESAQCLTRTDSRGPNHDRPIWPVGGRDQGRGERGREGTKEERGEGEGREDSCG
jgi:hypothetical protein